MATCSDKPKEGYIGLRIAYIWESTRLHRDILGLGIIKQDLGPLKHQQDAEVCLDLQGNMGCWNMAYHSPVACCAWVLRIHCPR